MMNQDWEPCAYCEGISTETHHDFEGNGRRELSEMYGLTHRLCTRCHRTGQQNATDYPKGPIAMKCKIEGQQKFEKEHGSREDFIRIFQTNVLE